MVGSRGRGRGMVGSGGWGVVRGRSMVGSLGVRVLAFAGVVALGDVVRADLALVLDVGVILLILVNVVVDNLCPAVGKLDLVLTLDSVSVPDFGLGVNIWVAVGVILVDVIPVVVSFWLVVWLWVIWCGVVGLVVNRSWGVVGCGVHWGWVNWSRVDRGVVGCWSRSVVGSGGRGVVGSWGIGRFGGVVGSWGRGMVGSWGWGIGRLRSMKGGRGVVRGGWVSHIGGGRYWMGWKGGHVGMDGAVVGRGGCHASKESHKLVHCCERRKQCSLFKS